LTSWNGREGVLESLIILILIIQKVTFYFDFETRPTDCRPQLITPIPNTMGYLSYADSIVSISFHQNQNINLYIASLSFGATRKFSFRHIQTKEKVEMWLQPGQLIVMRGETQQYWQHRLNRSTKILQPRINLTFRQFKFS